MNADELRQVAWDIVTSHLLGTKVPVSNTMVWREDGVIDIYWKDSEGEHAVTFRRDSLEAVR